MRRLGAFSVYMIMSATMSLAFATIFTGLAVYYIAEVGMSPFQLVLVGTVLEGTILLFELPTGIVADTYSRRLSVIIGTFVLGVAFLLEGMLPFVAGVLLAEAVRGLGHTFHSGALEAWLADEVGAERLGAVYVRSGQVEQVAGLVGMALSVGLASISLRLPVLVGGGMFIALGLFLLVAMPETGFKPVQNNGDHNPLRAMGRTLREGVLVARGSTLLMALIVSQLVVGAAGEGFDRLWEVHLLRTIGLPEGLTPVAWFAALGILSQLVNLAALRIFQKRVDAASATSRGSVRLLMVLQVVAIVATIGFALAGNLPLAVLALLVRNVAGALIGPLFSSWQAQQIAPQVRATVLSMASLSNAFGQTVGGPGVGVIGNRSLRAALVLAGLLFTPLLGVYSWAGNKQQSDVEGELASNGSTAD